MCGSFSGSSTLANRACETGAGPERSLERSAALMVAIHLVSELLGTMPLEFGRHSPDQMSDSLLHASTLVCKRHTDCALWQTFETAGYCPYATERVRKNGRPYSRDWLGNLGLQGGH